MRKHEGLVVEDADVKSVSMHIAGLAARQAYRDGLGGAGGELLFHASGFTPEVEAVLRRWVDRLMAKEPERAPVANHPALTKVQLELARDLKLPLEERTERGWELFVVEGMPFRGWAIDGPPETYRVQPGATFDAFVGEQLCAAGVPVERHDPVLDMWERHEYESGESWDVGYRYRVVGTGLPVPVEAVPAHCACQHGGKSCWSVNPGQTLQCTLPAGHEGDHMACNSVSHHLARWPQEQPEPGIDLIAAKRERLTAKQADEIEAEMRRMESNANVTKTALRLFMQSLMPCGHPVGALLTCADPPYGCVLCGEPEPAPAPTERGPYWVVCQEADRLHPTLTAAEKCAQDCVRECGGRWLVVRAVCAFERTEPEVRRVEV
jgi:hypothetical protein